MFIQKEGLKRTLTLREIKRKPEIIAIKKKGLHQYLSI